MALSDIKQKILFQVGAKGTDKAAKSFGAVAAKAAAIGVAAVAAARGLNKMYDKAIALQRQIENLNTDMSLYNERTAGLIDTNAGLTAAIQFQERGLRLTREQMSALGVAAVQMNQRLGGKPGQATDIFNQLTKSVINARETGLVKFGIELSQTGDKAAASQEALDKLVEKFGDAEVEAQTAKEAMFAFNNSLGTVKAALFNGILENMKESLFDVTTALTGSTTAMSDFEADIVATNGAIAKWQTSIDGIAHTGAMWIAQLMDNQRVVQDLNMEYEEQVRILTEIADLQRATAARREAQQIFAESEGPMTEDQQRRALAQLQRIPERDLGPEERALLRDLQEMEGFRRTIATSRQRSAEIDRRMGRRGGGRRAPTETREQRISRMLERAPVNTGPFSGGPPEVEELGLGGIAGRGTTAGDAAAQAQQLAMVRAQNEEWLTQKVKEEEEKRTQLRKDAADQSIGIMNNFSKAMNQNSKAGFEASKALAYSSNIVETIRGAMGAYNQAMAAIPPPFNVPVAVAAAASVSAAGARAGANIRKQKFGGSGGGSTSVSGVGGTSFPSGGQFSGGSAQDTTIVNNIIVDGQTIHKSMVKANNEANQSGNPSFSMDDD